ncbi:MAG: hypothetical protein HOQ45_02755, partial [Nocardioidaceae bacterium]|nr:hypothetical protein [Nocardioidaceae bacterium]
EEAAAHLAAARAEADDLRSRARRHLEDAQEEVRRLNRRREEITRELGDLSGVIQALAVPGERGDEGPEHNHDGRPAQEPEEPQEMDVSS